MRLAIAILLTAWTASGSTYFVDWTAGSDAANGLSKTAAFKRAPGMKGFVGSYSYASGDRFIFKGGTTWPAACFQWKITTDSCYYGVDVTWYSGSSFSRPVFDFENVALGYWTIGAGFLLDGADSNTIDNLDFKRHRTPLAAPGLLIWGTATITFNGADANMLTNCVIRDWDQPAMTTGNSGGGGVIRIGNGNNRVRNCLFHQDNVTQKSGTATWNMAEVSYCEFRNMPTAIMYSGWATEGLHHNWIHNLPDPADPAAHSNAILSLGGRRIHSNLIHDTTARAQIIFINSGYYGAETSYVYNNVTYNNAQPSLAIDSDGVNSSSAKTYVWNNSFEGAYSGAGLAVYSGFRDNGPIPHLEIRNNHFISANPISIIPVVTTYVHSSNLTNTYAVANAAGYTTDNAYQPTDGADATVGAGADLSAYFTVDRLGLTRSAWDIGAYEWSGSVPTNPGTITFTASDASVSEDAGTVTLTVQRTGGSSGAVGVSYATADGTAAAGVNYTASSGTLSWADGNADNKTITVSVTDADVIGSETFTVTLSSVTGGAVLGATYISTVTINGTGVVHPAEIPSLDDSFAVTEMLMTAPFVEVSGLVYQSSFSSTTNDSGILQAYFTLPAIGDYQMQVGVRGETTGSDSFWVCVNGTNDVFDIIPLTSGVENRWLNWRGSGTFDAPEFRPMVFTFDSVGPHYLAIYGREAGAAISNVVWVASVPPPPPQSLNFALSSTWTTDDQTEIVLEVVRSGGTAGDVTVDYATADGTALAGTDYTTTSGTLTFVDGDASESITVPLTVRTNYQGTRLFTVTLTNPSAAAAIVEPSSVSVALFDAFEIDTTAPTITIGSPSQILSGWRDAVTWSVLYSDTFFDVSTLTASDVTLNKTGTANGTVSVLGAPGVLVNVTVANITGIGTLSISLASGTGVDQSGNLSAAAGPSESVIVKPVWKIDTLRVREP